MAGFKVRLGDGSEIGPMDLAALRTWISQGLIDADSPVMRPGSRKWVEGFAETKRLATTLEFVPR